MWVDSVANAVGAGGDAVAVDACSLAAAVLADLLVTVFVAEGLEVALGGAGVTSSLLRAPPAVLLVGGRVRGTLLGWAAI
jgi:hypothetical protein